MLASMVKNTMIILIISDEGDLSPIPFDAHDQGFHQNNARSALAASL